ncbi:MAG: hypothetical protein ACP5GO_00415 [Thermoprotei archaeon]|jgi:hypothetical protein
MSSNQKRPSSYVRYLNLVIGIVLALLLVVFGSESIADGVMGLLLALLSYAAAMALLYVTILNYYRVQRLISALPEKTFTVYKCPSCGYQLTKDFVVGDYVGKTGESCPKDGTPMIVEKIYTVIQNNS